MCATGSSEAPRGASRADADVYRQAGVDIDHAEDLLRCVRREITSTFTAGVVGDVGGFGGVFQPALAAFEAPVLVSSIDGVGTKLRVAAWAGRHDTVGEDLVNHCTNDIAVLGADPLFFLDYIGAGRLSDDVFPQVLAGIVRGCRANGCALIGGETAEMPGLYGGDDYDLVGCIVGIADRARLITGGEIEPGDVLYGFASNGLHTNGYSLARKVLFADGGPPPDAVLDELGESLSNALLRVHSSYLPVIRALRNEPAVRGFAHLTGGGWFDNIRRILPEGCRAVVRRGSWTVPPVFRLIQRRGGVDETEMHRVFNMGVGLVLVGAPSVADAVRSASVANGVASWEVGRIEAGDRGVEFRGDTT